MTASDDKEGDGALHVSVGRAPDRRLPAVQLAPECGRLTPANATVERDLHDRGVGERAARPARSRRAAPCRASRPE